MPGETGRSLQVTRKGSYTVAVTDTNGCTSHSDRFIVTTLSVHTAAPEEFSMAVYPDPNAGQCVLSLRSDRARDVEIIVLDLLGRIRIRMPATITTRTRYVTLDFSNLTSGGYMIIATGGNEILRRMVIRE